MSILFKNGLSLLCAGLMLLISSTVIAGEEITADEIWVKLVEQGLLPEQAIKDVEPAEIEGFWRVVLITGAQAYVPTSLEAMILGKLLMPSDEGVEDMNSAYIQRMFGGEMLNLKAPYTIDYVAEDEKAVIFVFTDVNCGYCRLFHKQIDSITASGITVRYIPYPVISEKSPKQMQAVWCAADPQKALTDAKLLGVIPEMADDCPEVLITKGRDLGSDMGVRGTPAVYNNEAKQIGSYMELTDLVKKLQIQD